MFDIFGYTNFEGDIVELKKKCLVFVLLVTMFFLAGCGGEKKSEGNRQEQKEMPRAIMEIESGLLAIMQQADLLPATKTKAEQSQPDSNGGKKEQENGESSTQVNELTYEETILGELLNAEGVEMEEQQLPESTEIIWDNIKNALTKLYIQWNDLEPLLMEKAIPQAEITSFEEGLDSLTVFTTEQNHFGTMDSANQLTGNLANFMVPFAENIVSTTYELKFHLRNLVLEAATDDYTGAQESLDYIREQQPVLAKSLDKGALTLLETSVDNLQRVLDKQNLELVILNASVVMENIVQSIEKISNTTL